jgi:hypothetical protein
VSEQIQQLDPLLQLGDLTPQPAEFREQHLRIGHIDHDIIHSRTGFPLFM